ncbi:DsbC family protein [Geobacter metallireducens]|nr:DsbC family protein [Geobacter metallireducens]
MKWLMRILLPFAFVSTAYGFGTGTEGCSGNCIACHTIKKEEVVALVKNVDPATTVESVGPSPVRGLFEIIIRHNDSTGIIYLDFSKKFLIAGRILDTGSKKDVTATALNRVRRIDPSKLPLDNALVLGNATGSRNIYVFTDPECPFCAKFHRELVALTKEDPQLGVRIILTPLDIHPRASAVTNSILCAAQDGMDKGLRLLEESFNGTAIADITCGRDYAEEGKTLFKELRIRMTPTTVLSDGRVVDGVKTGAEIEKLFDDTEHGVITEKPQ